VEPIQVAEHLKEKFPEAVTNVAEHCGQVSVTIGRAALLEVCRSLRDEPGYGFDMIRDLTAVDYLGKRTPRFEVVYHIYSVRNRTLIRLKVLVDERDPWVDSVQPIWIGADWHERECYDLFGITFKGHPDLRRILMPEDWEGHPLRKDYPVAGPAKEWAGYQEVLDDAKRLKEFEWQN
jgi:NADH-quinone oxidoreductase subunit C